jgi:hypothetical protein
VAGALAQELKIIAATSIIAKQTKNSLFIGHPPFIN